MEDKFTVGNIEYDLLIKTEVKQQIDLLSEEKEAIYKILNNEPILHKLRLELIEKFDSQLKQTYVIPDNHVNQEGNIVFIQTFISSNSKVIPVDAKKYITRLEVDPVSDLIVNMECECEAWKFGEGEPCKHLNRTILSLHNLKIATGEFD